MSCAPIRTAIGDGRGSITQRPSSQTESCINTEQHTESGRMCSTFVGMSNPELLDAAMLQALEEHMRLAPTCEIVGVRVHVMLNHSRFEHQLHHDVCLRTSPRRRGSLNHQFVPACHTVGSMSLRSQTAGSLAHQTWAPQQACEAGRMEPARLPCSASIPASPSTRSQHT